MNWKLSYFGKLVTEERWSLTRSDGSRSPDFTYSRNIKIPGLLHIRIPLIFFSGYADEGMYYEKKKYEML